MSNRYWRIVYGRATVLVASAIAGGVVLSFTTASQAQVFYPYWRGPAIAYERDFLPELIGNREMRRILFYRGYRIDGRLRRNGHVYVADVRDRRGRSLRLIVDVLDGRILEAFSGRIRTPKRRFSHSGRQPLDLGPKVKPGRAKPVRKPTGVARKPSPRIVSRPLAPLVKPQAPARVEKRSAKPAIAARPAGPKVVPDRQPAANREIAPKQETVIARRSPPLLPPPAPPAPVEIDIPKKAATLAPRRGEGPPLQPERGAGAISSRGSGVGVAPLDDPGKRRNVEKPVAVAPLH